MSKIHVLIDWLLRLPKPLLTASYALLIMVSVVTFDVELMSGELTHQNVAKAAQAQPDKPVQTRTDASAPPATTAQPITSTPAPTPALAPKPTVQQPAPTPTPAYDKVSIPSLGFSSQIVTVGLTNTNAIDVHPSLVGWWNGSARPGTNGATFLDGHNPGVFKSLLNIKTGAQITVALADGQSYTYTVVHTEVVPLVGINMKKALTPYGNARQGLNLMTCMGPYNPATGTTDHRLVVYATR